MNSNMLVILVGFVLAVGKCKSESKLGNGTEKKLDTFLTDICPEGNNCNRVSLTLNNYCCGSRCCNMFTYIFHDE